MNFVKFAEVRTAVSSAGGAQSGSECSITHFSMPRKDQKRIVGSIYREEWLCNSKLNTCRRAFTIIIRHFTIFSSEEFKSGIARDFITEIKYGDELVNLCNFRFCYNTSYGPNSRLTVLLQLLLRLHQLLQYE